MRSILLLFISCALIITNALPVKEKKQEASKDPLENANAEDLDLNLEYGRYLQEVITALESDHDFRKKLESAKPDDIKSGKIARDLDFVDHGVRTKLDELKRREMDRLRQLAKLENEKKNGADLSRMHIPQHVDHKNPHKFEAEDLRKLIQKLNTDLEEADKERQNQFKTYEMEKNYKYEQELKGMDEEHKNQARTAHEEQQKKHKEHPKLHHPGSKQQLEEVWEEQDHLNKDDFNPNTFFHLHDLDGNGYWDEVEVKALFQKELDKMYDPNATEDDVHERYEEMERMREHVFKETDYNRDDLISFDEFMEQTKKSEYERDEGWQGLDEQNVYSDNEYEQFQHERDAEIQRLVEAGEMPPPPGYDGMIMPIAGADHQGYGPHDNPPVGSYPQFQQGQGPPQGYQAVPQQGYQAVPQQGYQAVPQQGYQAVPQQGYQAVPQQGYQAVPQQGYQAVPQQGYQAVPQQGYQPVPQQGYQPVPQHGQQAVPQQGQQAVPQQGHQAVPQQLNQGVPPPHVAQAGPQQVHQQGDPPQASPSGAAQANIRHPAQNQSPPKQQSSQQPGNPPSYEPINPHAQQANLHAQPLGQVPPLSPVEGNHLPGSQ